MKRYKLLKDLPTFKAGDEFRLEKSGLWKDKGERIPIIAYAATTLEKFPNIIEEWFEEILERPKTVGDLKEGDECWVIDCTMGHHTVVAKHWLIDMGLEELREIGRLYLTAKEAWGAIEKDKAKVILERDTKGFKPDWKDEEQPKHEVSYNHHTDELRVTDQYTWDFGTIVFSTEEDAEASINAHEKEWKIYLGLEE